MNTKTRLPALALSAALTVALLAACSTAPAQTAPVVASPTAVATQEPAPAPVATEAPCTVPAVGTTVMTMDEIYCAEDAGLIAYRVSEGAVIIDPAAGEIPAGVQKEMAAAVVQAIESGDMSAVSFASDQAAASIARSLRRPVAVIVSIVTADGPRFAATGSEAAGSLGPVSVAATHDATVAQTKAWIADQDDAAEWAIVDATL